jgi:DNA polymerase-4
VGVVSRSPRASAGRRDWGDDDSGAPILHVDMDAFFAEVELLHRPALRGRPVIVGGATRGVVLSASYEARAHGVHSAMPMREAQALCPTAVVVPPDHHRYRSVSRAVMAILGSVTPVVEPVSIDEAFLDVSGARRRLGGPVDIGAQIRRRIRDELGVPASVGVAPTKLVAKLASAHAKPDGLLLVPRPSTLAFLHSLPIGALWGVGERTGERLAGRGIGTIGDLARAPLRELQAVLGETAGRRLLDLAWGRDPRAVEPMRQEKSIGTEGTFERDVTDRDELTGVLLQQTDRVAARLRVAGLLARTVSIKVRMSDFSTLTRSQVLNTPTDLARDLYAAARRLFGGVVLAPAGVRLLGVRVEGLVPATGAAVQDTFDDLDAPDWRGAECAMDLVRARYGSAAVTAGSLVGPPATAATIGDLS